MFEYFRELVKWAVQFEEFLEDFNGLMFTDEPVFDHFYNDIEIGAVVK